jgi:hypothetical protein
LKALAQLSSSVFITFGFVLLAHAQPSQAATTVSSEQQQLIRAQKENEEAQAAYYRTQTAKLSEKTSTKTFWQSLNENPTIVLGVLGSFLGIVGASIAWIANEWRKRVSEDYQRKEANYRELLKALRGFYSLTEDNKLKESFLEQINLCWLYCPDEVIGKAYDFLGKVERGDSDKELAAGEFILAIRKDLFAISRIKKTELAAKDFRHLVAKDVAKA